MIMIADGVQVQMDVQDLHLAMEVQPLDCLDFSVWDKENHACRGRLSDDTIQQISRQLALVANQVAL